MSLNGLSQHVLPRYRRARRLLCGSALALGTAVGGIALAAPAAAAPHDWTGVAECESSGNWHINTGNGYYGGLQISRSTWRGFGGRRFARLPHRATRVEQIKVAERIKRAQGWGAWPHCSARMGLR